MMRTLVLVLACVLLAAPPADAKKRHPRGHGLKAKLKAKKSKKVLVQVHEVAPPTRVASVVQHSAPPPEVSTPAPAPAPPPPIEHGPMGPQAGDDEVPGSRTKR